MFAQIFIVFVGLASLVLGIQDGDYLWADDVYCFGCNTLLP
ncbi:hypothetical protein [Shewanella sp. UCD-KL21]|nr:hypothetical protein [Shewanella sp. UCD-KL21]